MTMIKGSAKVNASGGLHLRFEPAVRDNVLATLDDGVGITLLDTQPMLSEGLKWFYVDSSYGPGFVAADYVKVVTAASAPAPTPAPVPVKPPAPVLAPTPTGKHRIGLHVLPDGVAAAQAFILACHPPSVTVVDAPDFANWAVNAGVPYVVYRSVQTANGDDVHVPEDDPATSLAAGRKVIADRWGRFSMLDKRVFIQITNEQGWNPGHNAFWQGVMIECEARGYRAAIGCYGVGYPEPAQWAQLVDALTRAKANGHIVVLHAYGAPDAQPGQMSPMNEQQYFEERFPRFYAAVPDTARPPLVIGEYGGEFSRGKFQGTANLIHLVGLYEAANAPYGYVVSVNLWTAGHNGTGPGNWLDACIDSALPELAGYLNK